MIGGGADRPGAVRDARSADVKRALLRHEPACTEEAESRRRMLALLAASATPFARSHFEPGHFTASAFVLSPGGGELLLIHHSKLDRWLQPGGHIDADDASPLAAARRELLEEAGVAIEVEDAPLFDVDVHPIPANPHKGEPPHKHFDLRFLLRAATNDFIAGSDALDARWVPLPEAATVEDASVRRAVAKLQRRAVARCGVSKE